MSRSRTPGAARYAIEDGVVTLVFQGTVTADDIVALRERYLADPAFRPGMGTLVDLRRAAMGALTSSDLRRIGEHGRAVAARRGRYRSAIVAPADIDYGLMRVYEAFGAREDHDVQVFRTMKEARTFVVGETD